MPDSELIEKQTVLLVDDAPENQILAPMSSLLKDSYKIKMANNGNRAPKLAPDRQSSRHHSSGHHDAVMDGY